MDTSSGSRFQVRLWDLAVGVVGSAFVLDVARRSRAAWGGGLPDPSHALGLIVLTLGVGLGLVVVGQRARRLRDRAEGSRVVWVWAATWRAMALGWLAWSVSEVAWALQADRRLMAGSGIVGLRAEMRLSVIPLMTAFGLVGLVLATSPLRPRRMTPGRGHRSPRVWPSAVLAALAGLACMAMCYAIVPYLILLAIEAVSNAMTRAPLVPRLGLADRLAKAGFEAIPGLAGCLAMAIWIDEDLHFASRDPVAARVSRSWTGVFVRVVTTALAAIGGASLLFVSVPRLHPYLAEAIATLIDPGSVATVVLGFGALAAGLAARVAARLADGDGLIVESSETSGLVRPRDAPWLRRIFYGVSCLVVAEVAAAAIQSIRSDTEPHWYIPVTLEKWGILVEAPSQWLGFGSSSRGWSSLTSRPNEILLMVATAWLAIRLAGLLASRTSGRPAPLDAILGDRLAFGRFLGWWVALSTLMLAALPVLAVVGVVLTHVLLRWIAG